MKEKVKKNISNWLNRFEFVKWDRFIETQSFFHIYGWIEREDQYKDFLVVNFDKRTGKPEFWISSSARFDYKIIEVFKHLGTMKLAINIAQCKRADAFFDVVNTTRLKERR